MTPRILLIGATGGTGRLVFTELQQHNLPSRLLVRDLAAARSLLGDADFFESDALASDLAAAFAGITAVISTLGSREPDGLRAVDLPATARLIDAARTAAVSHFVLCSTIGAVPTPGVPDHLVAAFAPKGEAESLLRQSGLPFTIIRPGRLVDAPMEEPRAIERGHVARALVEALARPDALGATYELNQARLKADGADPIFGLKV